MIDAPGYNGQVPRLPREYKGGIVASADVPLLKEALQQYITTLPADDDRIRHAGLLLHRLGRMA
jgi:hypothetical protein